jgi:hypothetical protein
VLRTAGETEPTQENIQNWLELDGDPGIQLLTEEGIAAVIFFYLFSSAPLILLQFQLICFLIFLSFMAIFLFINPDYRLIWITSLN